MDSIIDQINQLKAKIQLNANKEELLAYFMSLPNKRLT